MIVPAGIAVESTRQVVAVVVDVVVVARVVSGGVLVPITNDDGRCRLFAHTAIPALIPATTTPEYEHRGCDESQHNDERHRPDGRTNSRIIRRFRSLGGTTRGIIRAPPFCRVRRRDAVLRSAQRRADVHGSGTREVGVGRDAPLEPGQEGVRPGPHGADDDLRQVGAAAIPIRRKFRAHPEPQEKVGELPAARQDPRPPPASGAGSTVFVVVVVPRRPDLLIRQRNDLDGPHPVETGIEEFPKCRRDEIALLQG